MELVSTQTSSDASGLVFSVDLDDGEFIEPVQTVEVIDPEFELGLWLAGLDSFLSLSGHLYAGSASSKDRGGSFARQFRISYAALLQCSRLSIGLRRAVSKGEEQSGPKVSVEELDEFALALRDALILNESFVKSGHSGHGEWRSWQSTLGEKLRGSRAFARLSSLPADDCVGSLPSRLQEIFASLAETPAGADLRFVLPKFARVLKALSVVGRMLRNDEPLKPALLVFAFVYEQTRDLVTFINNRLAKFDDETAELFGLLDGASYTISMELKKVFEDELRNVIGIRPAPSVYARTEAAYSLLTESFQQLLAGFARLADPDVTVFHLFPNFEEKLNESLILRSEIKKLLDSVRAAEQNPDKQPVDTLRAELTGFLGNALRFLFYKDTETFERFAEEVFAAGEKKDLVPILHRFGAYLETLFGQVSMRAVLADHPIAG